MSGKNIIEDNENLGWPSTSKSKENIQKVHKVIHSNRCLTIHEVVEEAGISKTMCHEIPTENLGTHHVAAKSVLRLLSEDQKQNQVDVSKELVDHANTDKNFLKNILTDDETWLYYYDVEKKAQSLQWVPKTSPRSKKSKASSVLYENDTDCVFWLWGHNSSWISTSWPDTEHEEKAERGS